MKKFIFLLVILISLVRLQAQTKIGVTAGVHLSDLSSSTSGVDASPSTLFHGGVDVDIKIPSTNLEVLLEALYTVNGYQNSNILAVDKNGENIGYIENEKLSYVQIPALLLYRFEYSKFNLKLGAGPYGAIKTNETMKIKYSDTFKNTLVPTGTSGPASVLGGAEVYACMELSKFFISADFDHSFTNIYQDVRNNSANWKINTVGISLGYFLK
ncbi:MAG TPA: outer membrane beta-barrel protein [Chitinophagaceae bacterium]|jgi:hypothetical protein